MTANAEQIEYWNGAVGECWAAFQPVLDKALSAISDTALAFAAAKPGERVLDVGCGTGTTTYALAKTVGPGGDVTGVDISRPMLAVARSRGVGVNFREADAATHLFHPTHDLVFSRFGVMFFADPAAAFANIRKAIAPHGRLAFVCWRDMKEKSLGVRPYCRRAFPAAAAGTDGSAGARALRLRRRRKTERHSRRRRLSRHPHREARHRDAHGARRWMRPRIKRSGSDRWREPPPNSMTRLARKFVPPRAPRSRNS